MPVELVGSVAQVNAVPVENTIPCGAILGVDVFNNDGSPRGGVELADTLRLADFADIEQKGDRVALVWPVDSQPIFIGIRVEAFVVGEAKIGLGEGFGTLL